MQQSKIDAIVNQVIDGVQKKGRGFVLDLAEIKTFEQPDRERLQTKVLERVTALQDGLNMTTEQHDQLLIPILREIDALIDAQRGVAIEVRESLPPRDEWEKPADWRSHTLGDTDSFIRFVQRYGDPERSLVMIDAEGCTVCLDEHVARGERELIKAPFLDSEDWLAWSAALGRKIDHRQLMRFLVGQEHNLDDISVLQTLRTLRLNSSVSVDSDVQDTGDSIGIVFKNAGGEDLKKFKRRIPIRVPVLDQDAHDDASWLAIEIRLDLELPTKPGEPVMFVLSCSNWRNHRLKRVRDEMRTVADALGETWTVVLGTHQTRKRAVGGAAKGDQPF